MRPSNTLSSPFGSIILDRFPAELEKHKHQSTLRAWDAADEYLLTDLYDSGIQNTDRLLILNDSFGALTVSLSAYRPVSINDSSVSLAGARHNFETNNIDKNHAQLQSTLDPLSGIFNIVLIKIPRTLALLEEELYHLKPHIDSNTRIVAGGMTRHVHKNTLEAFSRILGPVKTSLARKKARLIYCEPDSTIKAPESPYPSSYELEIDNQIITLISHANVFSRERLDMGTQLMLENVMTNSEPPQRIIDLGCGNGILGVVAALVYPDASIHFIDESYMAVESARKNMISALGERTGDTFETHYRISSAWKDTADLIINNPPFHHQNANNDAVAWQMFQDARQALRKNGELRVVGNRHLGYHIKMKRLFGNCRTVASNARFVILSSIKKKD